ncbi:MAG: nucleotidyltransferase family protein [Gammaproteobacteria bacterium]|nr:nucleotidyltransferase family protein [Gammaproteobacteria bacterium]
MSRTDAESSIAAIVLAAGRSTRMDCGNKLLADIGGKPMLHRTLSAIEGISLQQVVVVTGFQSNQIKESISQYPVGIVHNPHYRQGLSTSLRAGILSLADSVSAAIVFLADMPDLTADVTQRLVYAHLNSASKICIPVFCARRGNPILWPRQFFGDLVSIRGDVGGRHLVRKFSRQVQEVPVQSNSIFNDIDTSQDLRLHCIRRLHAVKPLDSHENRRC